MSHKPSSETTRVQMERSIDELADLARSHLEPGRFFAEVLGRARNPGGAVRAVLWKQSMEGGWIPAGALPNDALPGADIVQARQDLLIEISGEDAPRVIPGSKAEAIGGVESSPGMSLVLSPIRHAEQTIGILETHHSTDTSGRLHASTFPFFAALCEITADFLSQQELQQLRRLRDVWQQWDRYAHRLWQTLDLPSVCAAIANDGRLLAGCDRMSVLVRRGSRFQLRAVSGVDRIEPRSSATRSLELMARLVAAKRHSTWWTPSGELAPNLKPSENESSSVDALSAALERHAKESKSVAVGVIPVNAPRDDKDMSPPSAVIVFEQFHPSDDLVSLRTNSEMLVARSGLTLRSAIENSEIPFLGLWTRIRSAPQILFRPMTLVWLSLLAALAAFLILVPAEFNVTGPAELWPEHRRDVFAATSGVVEELLVKHGDEVTQGQPLIVLRDPELDTEAPRLIGEIATVNERLKGVQAARLTGGNTPDAAARARQLTADEEELKERLRTLEKQRQLIEERRAALTLRSPISGKVLTWDVGQRLAARPVERGQSLLTIGETSGAWIVEVNVADKDAGPMLRARQAIRPDLDVDFLLASEPGKTYRGHVRDVAMISESQDESKGSVRVIVGFERDQLEQPRPGATAVPRIRCGKQPIGYVWLHDLIDAIRMRLLF